MWKELRWLVEGSTTPVGDPEMELGISQTREAKSHTFDLLCRHD